MLSMLRSAQTEPRLPVADIMDAVAKGRAALIDVRELAELRASGKARGALHIPLSLIPLKANPATPDCAPGLGLQTPVYVYCASGGRSGMAAQALRGMGFAQVTNLGGFGNWVSAGGQVERV